MRKLLYLGFCLLLAAGVGCALTDYSTITDNDQTSKGGYLAPYNTNGKAHVRTAQKATLWGTSNDELIWFVDQDGNGNRTMTTYNNFSTSADPTFHDDLYCNPDWQGCAVWTAHDPPGEYPGNPAYDGTYNGNCSGARSLYLLIGTYRGGIYNYGECGRGGWSDKLAVLNSMQIGSAFGVDGLWAHLDRNNLTVTVNGSLLPVVDSDVFVDPVNRRSFAKLTHPLTGITLRALDNIQPDQGNMNITITYNGYTFQKSVWKWKDFAGLAERF